MSSKKNAPFNFEKSLSQLENLVTKMEQGQLPLEESLKYFEEGVVLIRQCQQALTEAEQKVLILTQQKDSQTLEPFNADE